MLSILHIDSHQTHRIILLTIRQIIQFSCHIKNKITNKLMRTIIFLQNYLILKWTLIVVMLDHMFNLQSEGLILQLLSLVYHPQHVRIPHSLLKYRQLWETIIHIINFVSLIATTTITPKTTHNSISWRTF